LNKYKKIKNEIINPVKVIDIAIKGSSIYSTTLDDNAFEVMKNMKENAYTHVPVLKNGSVIGVFSLYTVFAYLIEKGCVQISGDTKVGDLSEYITFEGHQGEYFKFVPKDCPVIDIEDLFAKRLEDNKRLVTIFITENGESDERLLGIVSAWDVASRR
jgi:CBS domain-containing protein